MYPFSNISNSRMLPIGVLPGAVYVQNPAMSFSVTPMQHQQPYYYHSVPPTLTPLPAPTLSALPKINVPVSKPSNSATTIFIGNINDKASDILVKTIFGKMGNIVGWKRVVGVGGKLQAFGFCEYDHPESTLRAIRLLHDFDLAGKKLVVKVDAKTKDKLKEYRKAKKKEIGITESDASLNKEEGEEDDDEMDGEWLDPLIKKKDKAIMDEIKKYVKDNIPAYTQENDQLQATKEKLSKTQKLGNIVLDEEKTEVISKEILRFKENNIKDEKYREKIREKGREKREREKMLKGPEDTKSGRAISPANSGSTGHETRGNSKSTALNERAGKGSRSRTKSPSRRGEKRRDRTRSPTFMDAEAMEKMRKKRLARELEEEEAHERRKMERKLREKEASYQEQLRLWEMRESKKHREHMAEKDFEDSIRAEEMREAKRLREFLEDYIDHRDDNKYYKGTFLARRLKEREKEMEMDLKDRQKEKEEIEELKQKLKTECHPNLEEEVAKLEKGRSQHLQPQLNLDENGDPIAISPTTSPTKLSKSRTSRRDKGNKGRKDKSSLVAHESQQGGEAKRQSRGKDGTSSSPPLGTSMRSPSLLREDTRLLKNDLFVPIAESMDTTNPDQDLNSSARLPYSAAKMDTTSNTNNHVDKNDQAPSSEDGFKPMGFKSISLGLSSDKKKGALETLFDADDDDDADGVRKKLPPLDLLDDGQKPLTLEEKRQSIKKLIEKIPTTKPQLFAYEIDWELVDAPLMEKRIRPWINKKIIEYIGEEEPTLVEFISSKLLTKSTPQAILDDILMVLDEEAEVFVVKMWRLLIYEIEAKKAGLVKCE